MRLIQTARPQRAPARSFAVAFAVVFMASALAAAVVVAPAASASHGASTTVLVNVQSGRDNGCSPDHFTSPDLQARVWLNNAVVAETYKAQDESSPEWLQLFEVAVPSLPATIEIEVREAEPGGFLGLGTSWITCDASPDSGDRLVVTIPASGTAFSGGGDTDRAAQVVGYAAPASVAGHPSAAKLSLASRSTSSLSLSWSGHPSDVAVGTQTLEVRGRPTQSVAWTASSATVDGLQENSAYSARVVRAVGGWKVADTWASFTTDNLPPPPPIVTASAGNGKIGVSWSAEVHDLQAVEIHVGDAANFTPSSATRKGGEDSVSPFARSEGFVDVTGLEANRTYHVVGVSVDTAGARTASSAIAVTVTEASPESDDGDAPNGGESSDSGGSSGTENRAPTAVLRVSPLRVAVGDLVAADASSSFDPEGDTLSFEWSWGDGTVTAGPERMTNIYSDPGSYGVRVLVRDAFGNVDEATLRVTVEEDGPAAPASVHERDGGLSVTIPGFSAGALVAAAALALGVASLRRRG